MNHVHKHTGLRSRARALAILAVLVGACSSADNLTNTDSVENVLAGDVVAADSLATDSTTTDSLTVVDSLAVDSLALDSAEVDPLAQLTPLEAVAEANFHARNSMAFGPEALWAGSTGLKSRAIPFTASTNYTDPRGIIKQISVARAMGQRLTLNMTGGGHHRYKSNGRFDLRKWKAQMNKFNTREIKAAVARGVADGTVMMNTVMDEPNVPSWGGVMTKPLLDQMAKYVKGMFPTLPVSVALRYDWRPHERFRVMDAYISQYSWYRGSAASFRDKGLAEARKQGMKMVFAMNLLNGGVHNFARKTCPVPLTGGKGTYSPACRMTASQVRDWGRLLGTAGCGLILWRYDNAFMAKSANVQAMRDVAATLARTPSRSCRRG